MDFMTSLPKYEGTSVIMVVVDRITKYAHFCVIYHPFKANKVATAFMDHIHGDNSKATWKPKYYCK